MVQSPKRIGLIGLSAGSSWASRSHIKYLAKTPLFKVTALQNSSKASAEASAEKYSLGAVACYDDPTAIASDPNVDIVAVSVKVPQHYALLRPAIEAGKDVFVEWPLAANLAQAEELTKLVKEKGIRAMVGLQARQNPSIIKAKEIVASGKLGKILGTTMYGVGLFVGPAMHISTEYTLRIETGANLITIPMGHAVDALCYVLGEIKELSATLANHYPEVTLIDNQLKPVGQEKKTAHDYVSISGTMVNGAVLDIAFNGGRSRTGRVLFWEITGSEGTLLLEGGVGHLQMYQPTLKFIGNSANPRGPPPPAENIEVEKANDPNADQLNGDFSFQVGKAWDAFEGVGLEKGYSVTTFEDALLRHKMIEAIYRSAEKGTKESYV